LFLIDYFGLYVVRLSLFMFICRVIICPCVYVSCVYVSRDNLSCAWMACNRCYHWPTLCLDQ